MEETIPTTYKRHDVEDVEDVDVDVVEVIGAELIVRYLKCPDHVNVESIKYRRASA